MYTQLNFLQGEETNLNVKLLVVVDVGHERKIQKLASWRTIKQFVRARSLPKFKKPASPVIAWSSEIESHSLV